MAAAETNLNHSVSQPLVQNDIQCVPQLFESLEFFHVDKSSKIECCGKKMHQIIQNMTLSLGLELELSLL